MTTASTLRSLLAEDARSSPLFTDVERAALVDAVSALEAGGHDPSPRAQRSNARHVTFYVAGLPVSQGSKTLGHTKPRENPDGTVSPSRAFMRESGGHALTAWRRAVRDAAKLHRVSWIRQSPLVVELKFVLPGTKQTPVGWAPVQPDIDKLTRGVLDALKQGKVLVDDAQVVMTLVAKVRGSNVGMWCRVRDAYDYRDELAFMEAEFNKSCTNNEGERR